MKGVALLALLAPFTFGSCVADSVSIRITCNVAPEGDCTYTEGGLCFLQGSFNLGANASSYFSVLRVTNGLKPRERDVPPQAEPNGMQITEVEVHITDSGGREPAFPRSLPNPFTVSASGFAEPGEEALVGAELLPTAYVAQIASLSSTGRALGSVRLSVIVRGETSGGVALESAAWPWTIQLVNRSIVPEHDQCVPFEDVVCTPGQERWTYACDPALVEP